MPCSTGLSSASGRSMYGATAPRKFLSLRRRAFVQGFKIGFVGFVESPAFRGWLRLHRRRRRSSAIDTAPVPPIRVNVYAHFSFNLPLRVFGLDKASENRPTPVQTRHFNRHARCFRTFFPPYALQLARRFRWSKSRWRSAYCDPSQPW